MGYANPDRRRATDRERYHRRTEERRAAGLCVRCGKFPPVASRANCESCAEQNRNRERARNERLKAEGRPRRDRRKARGELYGGRKADTRRKSARLRSERRRKEWLDAGLCTRCGQNRPAEDGTTCVSCRSRRRGIERKRYHDRRAAGLCVRCGQASTFDGASLCLSCAALEAESGRKERKNAASRRRYGERRQAGVCTDCQAPSHGASRCPECAERSYTRSAHFRGIPDWDPEFTVVDLGTGEEHGPFDSRPDADACAAFLKLPPGGFEVVAANHPLAGSVGWS